MREHSPEDTARTAAVLEELGSYDIVHVFGEIDLANVAEIDDVAAKARPDSTLVINLSDCVYLDSSVLATLVRLRNRRPGMRVVVPADQISLRRIFSITALDAALDIQPSLNHVIEGGRRLRAV